MTSRSRVKARITVLAEGFASGEYEVFCLTDGGLVFGTDVFPDLPEAHRMALLARAGESEVRTEFNAFLLRGPDGLTLVDTGCGSLFGPGCGRLITELAALDVTPDMITRLIFTHLHGDHCGGALQDGAVVFPEAEVLLHEGEAAFWQGKDAAGGQVLSAYADRLRLIADGHAIAPGLEVWALPGHTPGHIGLRVGEHLVIAGDILHSKVLQVPDPEISTRYDTDTAQARTIRKRAFAEIAANDLVFTGGHMVGPGKFARLKADGAGYRLLSP